MMTFRELEMRVRGQRKKFRLHCSFSALIAHHVAAYSMANTKGSRAPSIKAIVNGMMGKE